MAPPNHPGRFRAARRFAVSPGHPRMAACQEIMLMQSLDHPFVVRYVDHFVYEHQVLWRGLPQLASKADTSAPPQPWRAGTTPRRQRPYPRRATGLVCGHGVLLPWGYGIPAEPAQADWHTRGGGTGGARIGGWLTGGRTPRPCRCGGGWWCSCWASSSSITQRSSTGVGTRRHSEFATHPTPVALLPRAVLLLTLPPPLDRCSSFVWLMRLCRLAQPV